MSDASADLPTLVECPCGDGWAERLKTPTTEPNPKDAKERLTSWHYRHEGCPIGGTAVVLEGEVDRLIGPLFNPARYELLQNRAASTAPGLALADGGEPLEEGSR